MSRPEDYTGEIRALVGAYGEAGTAALLKVTPRAVQYWVAGSGSKSPRMATKQKIHELFVKHQTGENLKHLLNGKKEPDYRDEIIALLKERLNLSERKMVLYQQRNLALLRAIVETLPQLLAKVEKMKLQQAHEEMNKRIERHLDVLKREDI